jgi:hypothetical protein
MGGKFYNNV